LRGLLYYCQMKASELRIGNFVIATAYRSDKLLVTEVRSIKEHFASFGNKWHPVYQINHGFYESGSEWGSIIETEVHGIPLTEEWLLKFGFNNEGIFTHLMYDFGANEIGTLHNTILFKNGTVSIHKKTDTWEYVIAEWLDTWGDHYETKTLQYVHQLQNIFFDLTGQELIIK